MYTKFQLALQYFPDSIDKPDNAVHRLRAWILRNKKLCQALDETGKWRKDKTFTSRQVAIILEFLGDP